MKRKTEREADRDTDCKAAYASPHVVRLPGFVSDEEIGLGDAIKRVTSHIGMDACAHCESRAKILNRWMVLRGPRFK